MDDAMQACTGACTCTCTKLVYGQDIYMYERMYTGKQKNQIYTFMYILLMNPIKLRLPPIHL